uniref:Ribonuclease A-domain domain-containing protein n=1 Tax=Oryzias latipes TaxID=8090 RepID=A0A3P9M973_ORYLA
MKILLKSRYEMFCRQHIDKDMTENKCEEMIRDKNIYDDDNIHCKDTNTFIVDDPARVKRICNGEGKTFGKNKITKSTNKFTIVKCELKIKGARKPNCTYNGRLLTYRYLEVDCENNLPVHFYRDTT